jgi:hypothetical protein
MPGFGGSIACKFARLAFGCGHAPSSSRGEPSSMDRRAGNGCGHRTRSIALLESWSEHKPTMESVRRSFPTPLLDGSGGVVVMPRGASIVRETPSGRRYHCHGGTPRQLLPSGDILAREYSVMRRRSRGAQQLVLFLSASSIHCGWGWRCSPTSRFSSIARRRICSSGSGRSMPGLFGSGRPFFRRS